MFARQAVAQDNVVPLELGARQANARIHLLGTLRATSCLGQDLVPRGRKARAILGYLCLHVGQRVPRARIAALLWDRVPDHQARASLRQALRELMSAFGPLAAELIAADAETLRLDARSCWIDAAAMLSGPNPANLLRSDLAALCEGELLEDLSGITETFDEWLLIERARFSAQVTEVFESELLQIARSDVPPERRVALSRRIIACDPTHEGASRILMGALADLGERAQALREYERCRAAIQAALDAEPSPETQALYRALRTSPSRQPQKELETTPRLPAPLSLIASAVPSPRLRIGVLPFRVLSPLHADTAIAFCHDLASALARFRWFDVIAPASIKRTDEDTDQNLLQRMGVNYAIDGIIVVNYDKINIKIHLLSVQNESKIVFADEFELNFNQFNVISSDIVSRIVARIDPIIIFIEGDGKAENRFGSIGVVYRAIPLIFSLERAQYDRAWIMLEDALRSDPNNVKAMTWAAYWHVLNVGQGWSKDVNMSFNSAQSFALNAIRIDPENAEALGIYAHICSFINKDTDSALYFFDKALKLNPNIAFLWAMSAPTYCYIGEPDIALQRMARYADLAPFDPHARFWDTVYAIPYLLKADYEQAVRFGRRAVALNPEFTNGYKPLIAALGHLGRLSLIHI